MVLRMVKFFGEHNYRVVCNPGKSILVAELRLPNIPGVSESSRSSFSSRKSSTVNNNAMNATNNIQLSNDSSDKNCHSHYNKATTNGSNSSKYVPNISNKVNYIANNYSNNPSSTENDQENAQTVRNNINNVVNNNQNNQSGLNPSFAETSRSKSRDDLSTQDKSANDGKLFKERILHIECGDMFEIDNIEIADIVMLETDIPSETIPQLVDLLDNMHDGARTLTYLDLNKIWTPDVMMPFIQLDINQYASDRYATSWSVQRGHHFYLWIKVCRLFI